jgi:hypothetical protein
MSLCEVASFVTRYFRFKKSFHAKRKRNFTANLAISQNDCCHIGFMGGYTFHFADLNLNTMFLFQNILVDKYKFVLDENQNGFLQYNHDLGNGNYVQVQNFEEEHIFSLTYFLYGEKIVIANRYKCNTEAELEFILLKGRWGDYFQSMKLFQ